MNPFRSSLVKLRGAWDFFGAGATAAPALSLGLGGLAGRLTLLLPLAFFSLLSWEAACS